VSERFLVTGAHGCVGAWTVARLVREGTPVVGFDLGEGPGRASLLLDGEELARVPFVRGDVTRRDDLDRALDEYEVTHVIHLAALQLPYCSADPARGALVNVVGTVQVFDAVAARAGAVRGLAYASSIAVHGRSLYGAWKRANEETAAVYWQDHRLASVGLRPALVYGVGRDRGITSSATTAMLAAARGRPYEIVHGGSHRFQYAPDVARCFVDAARAEVEGAKVLESGGRRHDMRDVVAAIEAAAPGARITVTDVPLGAGGDGDRPSAELQALIGPIEWTPLDDGVRETIERFRALPQLELPVDCALSRTQTAARIAP